VSTSGTSTFNATRNEICRQAALLLNAVPLGQTMSAALLEAFAFMLNAMVKSWAATGIHVWATSEATLFPVAGQTRYGAGTGATDHITQTYYETAISVDEAAGQTTLSVDDTTNMTPLDNIGVVVDDGTIFWTTIFSKAPATVTITAPLPDGATSENAVFNYTSKIARPLKVVDAKRYNIDGETDTPMTVCSRKEYQNLPMKNQAGMPIQLFYDAQLTIGYFNLWQVPNPLTDLVKFTWHRPIMDFNASADNPDFPQEWILPLVYNLAKLKMPSHPVDGQRRADINETADNLLAAMVGFDRENESIFIQPDMEGY
jgi:hypothetical protein